MKAHKFLKMQALKQDTPLSDIAAELGVNAGYFWGVTGGEKSGYGLLVRIAEWLDSHDSDGEQFLKLALDERTSVPTHALHKVENRKAVVELFVRLWEEEQQERRDKEWKPFRKH